MILFALGLALLQGSAPPRLLDGFEKLDRWTAHPAAGVTDSLSSAPGHRGRGLRMDFDYHRSGGYAIARGAVPVDLPDNYELSFWLKGTSPPNTLEFKLVDSTGENVWWYTERDRTFDGHWHRVVVHKRQVAFAWGPAGGGEIRHVASIEIVITAGSGGGKGTVWIDDLELTPKPVILPYTGTPTVAVTSGSGGRALVDGNTATLWHSTPGTDSATVTLDFGSEREFGGVGLDWASGLRAGSYALSASSDRRTWATLAKRSATAGSIDQLYLPDAEGRYLRLAMRDPRSSRGFGLREITIEPLSAGASRNAFFAVVAGRTRDGLYPRYWSGERPFWTVVGQDGARQEALLSEDGAVEPGTGAFSIEPFLVEGETITTWRDGVHSVGQVDSTLPMPWVVREANDLRLVVLAFAVGPASRSSLIARYRVVNLALRPRRPTLFLAVRPFQVNPPTQFLNHPGGFTPIDSMRWTGHELRVGADRRVVPFTSPTRVGLSAFDQGEVMTRIVEGRPAESRFVRDSAGTASGAMAWSLALPPGDSADIAIEVPFVPNAPATVAASDMSKVPELFEQSRREWHDRLDATGIDLPGSGRALSQSITANLGYILVNRDSAAIQPGSRSYERSWIRDGALTSTALLRFGHAKEVRSFIEWFGSYVRWGRVPCCVDRRGADPVPELDSYGEFIYLEMEYFRHTGDTTFLRQQWRKVREVGESIDSMLLQSRRIPVAQRADSNFYGLLPPSISHEGYSAHPEHSYWDDFFAIRGLKDATLAASVVGDSAEGRRLDRVAKRFQADLQRSIARSMAMHQIDFIPGSADLGDFDATSTTIALSPVGAETWLPADALRRTFDQYWDNTRERRRPGSTWDAYTPYELRSVGAMLRLGEVTRAWTLLDEFLADQEPPAWHQWPEVVFHNPHELKFIGDLPHTWVGSDFLRSAADLFVYERESDSTLILGQGIKPEWLDGSGVHVRNLSTWWGTLDYTARKTDEGIVLDISPGVRVPSGGILVSLPSLAGHRALVDGALAVPDAGGQVRLTTVPAHLVIQ